MTAGGWPPSRSSHRACGFLGCKLPAGLVALEWESLFSRRTVVKPEPSLWGGVGKVGAGRVSASRCPGTVSFTTKQQQSQRWALRGGDGFIAGETS